MNVGADMRITKSKTPESSLSRDARKSARHATKPRKSTKQTRPQQVQTSAERVLSKVSQARKTRPSVPIADVPRIKTWLKFGLNMAQAASVYGVDEDQMRNTVTANKS